VRRTLVFVAMVLATRLARAEPDDVNGRPLVLDGGQLEARLTVEANLATGELGHATSLAPDVWWGVTSRWTVGVIHGRSSVDRFEPGASFCLVKGDRFLYGGCDRSYVGGGLDVRWGALPWLAPRVRLLVDHLAVWKPALTLGALTRWMHGRWSISGDPYLQLGIANTDRGNRAALFLPIAFTVQPTCRWALSAHSGWNSDLAVWTDGWHIPFALSVLARATEHVDLSAMVGFASLLGPQNTPKERALFLAVGWRS
jgi:hypothetical protein